MPLTWDTQTEWEAATKNNINVVNDTFELATAIPDSGDLHARYDFTEYSGSSNFSDLTGNGYDLVNGQITDVTESINGYKAGNFDGADDYVSTNTFSSISQPFTIFSVGRLDDSGSEGTIHALDDNTELNTRYYDYDDVWRLYGGSNVLDGGSYTGNPRIITSVYDGSNSLLRLDGSDVASGDGGTASSNSIVLGYRPDNNLSYFTGAIGELLYYPDRRTSTQINEVESYLSDEWGITI